MADLDTITVVIPTHDRNAVVGRAVATALGQVEVDVDVVVVDDGSASAVELVGDPRLQIVRNEVPQGVARARARGVAEASGEWIAFLDDDDVWAPTKLARQLETATRHGRAWAVTGVVAVDDRLEPVDSSTPANLSVDEIRRRNVVPGGASNVMVRADVLRSTRGFDPGLRHMADWDLWIQLCEHGPPAVVAEPLVGYVQHGANASLDIDTIADEIPVIERTIGSRVDRAFVYRWMAWNELRLGRRRRAARWYLRAALDGDWRSLGRLGAAVALGPSGARRRRQIDPDALSAAQSWLVDIRRG